MVQQNNSASVTIKRYVNKNTKASVQVVEVTQENLERVRELWFQPSVMPGEFIVRYGTNNRKVFTPQQFAKLYRKPY